MEQPFPLWLCSAFPGKRSVPAPPLLQPPFDSGLSPLWALPVPLPPSTLPSQGPHFTTANHAHFCSYSPLGSLWGPSPQGTLSESIPTAHLSDLRPGTPCLPWSLTAEPGGPAQFWPPPCLRAHLPSSPCPLPLPCFEPCHRLLGSLLLSGLFTSQHPPPPSPTSSKALHCHTPAQGRLPCGTFKALPDPERTFLQPIPSAFSVCPHPIPQDSLPLQRSHIRCLPGCVHAIPSTSEPVPLSVYSHLILPVSVSPPHIPTTPVPSPELSPSAPALPGT